MKISRLPLCIFENLDCPTVNRPRKDKECMTDSDDVQDTTATTTTTTSDTMNPVLLSELRTCICTKLAAMAHPTSNSTWTAGASTHNSNNTNAKKNQPTKSVSAIHTTSQLLQMSPLALVRILDPLLTFVQCQELIQRVCQHCAAKSQSVLELLSLPTTSHSYSNSSSTDDKDTNISPINTSFIYYPYRHISSGMKSLDLNLRGGFPIGSITEIVGHAGVGKTQLAMQLCFQVATTLRQGSIYIDTERKMSLLRLQQICHEKILSSFSQGGGGAEGDIEQEYSLSTIMTQDILSNIVIHTPTTINDLMNIINHLEENIAFNNIPDNSMTDSHQYPIRLIILDSIAALALREFSVDDAPQRLTNLFHIVQTLKRIASQWKLAIVVINQVTGSSSSSFTSSSSLDIPNSTFDSKNNQYNSNSHHHHHQVVHAALGSSWHHCVTTRLVLEYHRPLIMMRNDMNTTTTTTTTTASTTTMNNNNNMMMITREDGRIRHDDESIIHSTKRNYKSIEEGCIRKITVVKSNIVPCSSMFFEIKSSGLHECSK